MMDLLAARREHPPRPAELIDALSGRLAALAVAHEVVERVAVVRDLELPVLAPRRAEQRRPHAGPRTRLALREERWPERGARAVTDAGGALVGREVVQGDALAVDEDPAEPRLHDIDACAGLCAAGES